MKKLITILSYSIMFFFLPECNNSGTVTKETATGQDGTDTALAEFIKNIRAVDNHAHPNTIQPDDKGSDALPADGLGAIELPARVRTESGVWLAAARALYGFTGTGLNEKEIKTLAAAADSMKKEKGEKFPEWALDQAGIEVMMANRLGMGSGLSAPRFRWASYVDALLYPLSTKGEAAVTPDREKLFPLVDTHLQEFLAERGIVKLPATLSEYLKQVVTGTLEAQKNGGCLAVKFEAAYLRSLDFDKAILSSAADIYARYVHGGAPSNEQYKILQDFLFRYITREAGRLGMAVHIHSFTGVGNYFVAAGSDPLLLEPVFNDPELRNTKFVIIHGGGQFSKHTGAMLWKPNVFADISLLTQVWTSEQLAAVLLDWLSQFPEKVLFGTDAVSFGPGLGWEMSAWNAAATARQALTKALSEMVNSHEISPGRAKEIAMMVMRTNAVNLYNLKLP